MEGFTKITTVCVKKQYEPNDDGVLVCIGQEFMAGDIVEYEDDYQEPIECQIHQYQPYDMVQPKTA